MANVGDIMANMKLEKEPLKLHSAELHKPGTDLGKQRLGDLTYRMDCAQLWAQRASSTGLENTRTIAHAVCT